MEGSVPGVVSFRPAPGAFASDAALALMLPAAMQAGQPLRLDGAVSPRLLGALPSIEALFAAWGLPRVPVTTRRRRRTPWRPARRGTACFFSGGVDSFYSVLTRRAELTHLIFVHGFDVPLDSELRVSVSRAAREAAAAFGLELIEVETDLRRLIDRYISWELCHGAALASVALLFQERFRRVLIPSTHSYADLTPWGSHPLLDPLWSTELTEFIHDGTHATRLEKCLALADSDIALRHLRVCWENRNGSYNCGECEKCLRTMISLAAAGALDRCATLPHRLDAEAVAAMPVSGGNKKGYAKENLAALEATGARPDLQDALRTAISLS